MLSNIFTLLYEQILLEALWDTTPIDTDVTPFSAAIYKVYELEYKLNALNNYPFEGNPQRLENIKRYTASELAKNAKFVKGVILSTFTKWLASHAITNPKKWAEARIRDMDEFSGTSEILDSMIDEYGRYALNIPFSAYDQGARIRKYTSSFFTQIQKNLNKMPTFKKVLDDIFKEDLINQFYNDPETVKEIYGIETEEDLEKVDLSGFDIENVIYDIDTMSNFLDNMPEQIKHEIFVELYENIVFPVWYGNWKTKGIDKTRKTVEKTYKGLKSANINDMGNFIAQLSIALNAVHQTGPMLDYIENDTGENTVHHEDGTSFDSMREFLDAMSNGVFINNWKEDLKEVGINI